MYVWFIYSASARCDISNTGRRDVAATLKQICLAHIAQHSYTHTRLPYVHLCFRMCILHEHTRLYIDTHTHIEYEYGKHYTLYIYICFLNNQTKLLCALSVIYEIDLLFSEHIWKIAHFASIGAVGDGGRGGGVVVRYYVASRVGRPPRDDDVVCVCVCVTIHDFCFESSLCPLIIIFNFSSTICPSILCAYIRESNIYRPQVSGGNKCRDTRARGRAGGSGEEVGSTRRAATAKLK